MRDLYKILIEALVPTSQNTYKDKEGNLRWNSNHHLVSPKYFEKVKELAKKANVEPPKSLMPTPFDLNPNTVTKMIDLLEERGVVDGLDDLISNEDFVMRCPFLKNILEKIFDDKINDSNDFLNALNEYYRLIEAGQDDGEIQSLAADIVGTTFKKHLLRIEALDTFSEKFGLKKEDVVEKLNGFMKEYVDPKHSTINIRCEENILSKILQSGRFKSQFETGSSNGCLSYSARNAIEFFGQGYDIYKEDQSGRPIYGYITPSSTKKSDGENIGNYRIEKSDGFDDVVSDKGKLFGIENIEDDIRSASSYGNCICVMKDSVRDRTNVSFGDSLNHSFISSPISDPSILSTEYGVLLNQMAEYGSSDEYDFLASGEKFVSDLGNGMRMEYVEAQINGGVTANDINYVVLYCDGRDPTNYKDLTKQLKRVRIPFIKVFETVD